MGESPLTRLDTAQQFRYARREAGWTQEATAALIGRPVRAVKRFEKTGVGIRPHEFGTAMERWGWRWIHRRSLTSIAN